VKVKRGDDGKVEAVDLVMSYMRGRHYLWDDGNRLHLWVADGYDGWEESVWAEHFAGVAPADDSEGSRPSGVAIGQGAMDEYVVMRLAELVQEGLVVAAIDRALTKHRGNGGCQALDRTAASIAFALRGQR
jgi:hypothetical protein